MQVPLLLLASILPYLVSASLSGYSNDSFYQACKEGDFTSVTKHVSRWIDFGYAPPGEPNCLYHLAFASTRDQLITFLEGDIFRSWHWSNLNVPVDIDVETAKKLIDTGHVSSFNTSATPRLLAKLCADPIYGMRLAKMSQVLELDLSEAIPEFNRVLEDGSVFDRVTVLRIVAKLYGNLVDGAPIKEPYLEMVRYLMEPERPWNLGELADDMKLVFHGLYIYRYSDSGYSLKKSVYPSDLRRSSIDRCKFLYNKFVGVPLDLNLQIIVPYNVVGAKAFFLKYIYGLAAEWDDIDLVKHVEETYLSQQDGEGMREFLTLTSAQTTLRIAARTHSDTVLQYLGKQFCDQDGEWSYVSIDDFLIVEKVLSTFPTMKVDGKCYEQIFFQAASNFYYPTAHRLIRNGESSHLLEFLRHPATSNSSDRLSHHLAIIMGYIPLLLRIWSEGCDEIFHVRCHRRVDGPIWVSAALAADMIDGEIMDYCDDDGKGPFKIIALSLIAIANFNLPTLKNILKSLLETEPSIIVDLPAYGKTLFSTCCLELLEYGNVTKTSADSLSNCIIESSKNTVHDDV